MPSTCTAPGAKGHPCGRSAYALGLCEGHYAQQRRGQALSPLREGPGRVVVSVRVSPEAAGKVAEDREGAREAIERWAKKTG